MEPPSSPRAVCPAHAQFPGQSTSRKLNQSPRRNEFTYFSTLIGYHRGAGVWLFDPGTPGVSRERGRDPPGPGATRHWSSLISLGHEFWEVGCPWTKMVGHPPSKTRSFRIEGGRGQWEKGTYPPLLERRLSIEIDLAATFENILDRRWDQVWCMQVFVSKYLKMIHVVERKIFSSRRDRLEDIYGENLNLQNNEEFQR